MKIHLAKWKITLPNNVPKHSGHAKVWDLDVVAVVEENVLGLEVAMCNATRMKVLDARQDLFEVALCYRDCHADIGIWRGEL